MMSNYFTLLTDFPQEKIAELVNPDKTHPKQAKVLLGKTIVAQFHGPQAAEDAAAAFEKVFAQKQLPDQIEEVEIPSAPLAVARMLTHCKLVETGGEAKRMVKQGGVSIETRKLTIPTWRLLPGME
jgi:tyrosyl-tRNA synthetase